MVTIHILSFGFVLGVSALADKEAFRWIRGKTPVLDPRRMRQYHHLVWTGLFALILTGSYLFYPMRAYLLRDFLFLAKLFFVGILIVNSILIGRLMHVSFEKPFASLTRNEKMPLLISGAVSSFAWFCAVFIAMWMF